ncbi:MAG: rRNA maturation RNase YbeY [Candidatus Pacebacteria bacterium]|nr:rRNA maturation RNase YbeY [Candidatus Paceibacterota bacterium]
MSFFLHTTLKAKTPVSKKTGVLWSTIAKSILGARYDLSVVLVGNARSHRLNLTYRGKDKPTNVLAFPVTETDGEIYLNIPYAIKEAPRYDHAPAHHLTYLFIHGLLHLKGLNHGPKMEALEAKLLKRFA